MIRIAHCADVHYCPKHLRWVDAAFTRFVDDTIGHHVGIGQPVDIDAAVIAGDLFDSSMGIHEPAVAACLKQIIRLANHVPVLILQGTFSHDRPGSLDIFKQLPTTFPVFVADEPCQVVLKVDTVMHTVQWKVVTGELPLSEYLRHASAMFSCLPSLNKASPTIMEVGTKSFVEALASDWAIHNAEATEAGIPTVMVTHGTVNGSITESGYAMVSPDWEFDQESLFSFRADAVMMGHIHAHQDWVDSRQIIAYPGSLARLVHGDHAPKGFLFWEIEPGAPRFMFVEVPGRVMMEIDYDGPPDMDELAELAARATSNTHVKIGWSIDQEHAHAIDKAAIRALFENAAECKLEGVVNPVQSVRAAGIGKAMTLREKLGYYASTTGDEAALPELESRLEMLQSMDVEQIVGMLTS